MIYKFFWLMLGCAVATLWIRRRLDKKVAAFPTYAPGKHQLHAPASARTGRFFAFCDPETMGTALPPKSHLTGVCLYCVSTTVVSALLHRGNGPTPTGWYLGQLVAGLLFGWAACWRNDRNASAQTKCAALKGLLWLFWLAYCLLGSVIWHWQRASVPGFALCLTFAHAGVALFVLPYRIAWHWLVVGLLFVCCCCAFLDNFSGGFGFERGFAVGVGLAALCLLNRYKRAAIRQRVIDARRAFEDALDRRQQEALHAYGRGLDPSARDDSKTLQALARYKTTLWRNALQSNDFKMGG